MRCAFTACALLFALGVAAAGEQEVLKCGPGASTEPGSCPFDFETQKMNDGCWRCVKTEPMDLVAQGIEGSSKCGQGESPKPGNCPKDYEPCQKQNGCWTCCEYACINGQYDPDKKWVCCDDEQDWSCLPDFTKCRCCEKGHKLKQSTDPHRPSTNCCLPSYTWDGTHCVQPKPPPDNGNCTDHDCPACRETLVCPGVDEKGNPTLGIEYGKCYVLYFSDGRHLGRQAGDSGMYVDRPFYDELPFKVCGGDLDCSKTGLVHVHEWFTLQDQFGFDNGNKGWFDKGTVGGHSTLTSNPDNVARFGGMPACLGGQYAICVHGKDKGFGIMCPAPPPYPQGLSAIRTNPNVCTRLVFKEIACYDSFDKYKPKD